MKDLLHVDKRCGQNNATESILTGYSDVNAQNNFTLIKVGS